MNKSLSSDHQRLRKPQKKNSSVILYLSVEARTTIYEIVLQNKEQKTNKNP